MRSNDVIFGYKNDYAWQFEVMKRLVRDYNDCIEQGPPIELGHIYWQVQNLHVYERHFHLVK
jgi:thymidylate synthase